MDEATRELVRQRAGNRCEYCLHRQEQAETTVARGGPVHEHLDRLLMGS